MICSLAGTPDAAFKILGPLSITIAVVAGLLLVRRWPQGKKSSISHHAGAQWHTYWLFASVLAFDGLLFFLFMWRWFIPAFQLPAGFAALVVLGYLFQLATAVIPERADGSRLSRAHALVAFSMAVVMMLLVGWLALAPHIALLPRLLCGLTFAAMALFWYLFLFVKSTRRHFLVYQVSYIASFYVCILAVTGLG